MTLYGNGYGKGSNRSAGLSALLGLLGIALAPAAVVVSKRSALVTLVEAVIAIAAGCSVLGVSTLLLARRGKVKSAVSLGRKSGRRLATIGRVLGTLTLSVGLAACIAMAIYGALLILEKR